MGNKGAFLQVDEQGQITIHEVQSVEEYSPYQPEYLPYFVD